MFPQFTSTAASFSRATALLTRVGTDAQFYDDPETENFALLLDSKFEAEKIEGMKRLIALMSQGRDVSNFFPQVVKNVVTQSLELKKLVYIYLVHYAEKRPDEALLAMNTFQKDLSDLNPLVRAWALRAMSGIRVRVVLPLVVMAVNKCARDPSPYVRRCAAHAISKIYSLDREQHLDALEELICLLINDNSPGVIGAVAAAFNIVCPERLSLWGIRFHKLCELLPTVDEWGQVVLMDILLRYAVGRHGYPKGSIGFLSSKSDNLIQDDSKMDKMKGGNQEEILQDSDGQLPLKSVNKNRMGQEHISFLAEGKGLESHAGPEFWLTETQDGKPDENSQDVELLLQSTSPLLGSHNSAVVMAAAGVHWLLASVESLKKIVKPILFLIRSSLESQYVVLANISTFAKQAPSLFDAYYEDFFITSGDTEHIRALKLDILCLIATESSIQHILQEFQAYVRDSDHQFAANTVRAIGQCALRLRTISKACTQGLLLLARSGSQSNATEVGKEEQDLPRKDKVNRFAVGKSWQNPADRENSSREALVVTEAVVALQVIVHKRPAENEEVLARLVRGLDHLDVPAARAIVIWMVGEFCTVGTRLPEMVPVVLRYLGGSFKKEADEAKLQILNCAAKVVLHSGKLPLSTSKTALLILDYILRLAAQDLSYDIRDRARMYQHLLAFYLQKVYQADRSGNVQGLPDELLSLKIAGAVPQVPTTKGTDEVTALNVSYLRSDEGINGLESKKAILLKLAEQIFLVPKPVPILPSLAPDRSGFVAGSMSHIVQHRAPNYSSIPAPCTIELTTPPSPGRNEASGRGDTDPESSSNLEYSGGSDSQNEKSESICSPRSTGSFYGEENGEIHSCDVSSSENEQAWPSHRKSSRDKSDICPSASHHRSHRTRDRKTTQEDFEPLIQLSDQEADDHSRVQQNELAQPQGEISQGGLGLLSAAELDSWLGSSEPAREDMLSSSETPSGYATLSTGEVSVESRIYTLLDFTNGGGLDVKYCFERGVPISTQSSIWMKLFFYNQSSDTLTGILVKDTTMDGNHEIGSTSSGEALGTDFSHLVREQEVPELEPGGKLEGKLCIYIEGYLKPIKLSILCSGKTYSVKVVPDIGAVMKPLNLSLQAFNSVESRIKGMHEALRRCVLIVPTHSSPAQNDDEILRVAQEVAHRVLSCAYVSLVSTTIPILGSSLGVQAIKGSGGLQGLCLRFCGETLFEPSVFCLITVTVLTESATGRDGFQVEVMVKINCEDTMFGLSLLQELSKILNS